jgi:hypothetical protein
MARRAICLGLLALAASACGFDPAGGRANQDLGPGNADASLGGQPDGASPGTADGAAGGPDAGDPGGEVKVDEFTVPSTGGEAESTFVLLAGVEYRLVVSGIVTVSDQNGGFSSDAEYYWKDSAPGSVFDGQPGEEPIDIGVAIDDDDLDAAKSPDWGFPTADHVYDTVWPGANKTITATFHDPNYDNNEGSFTLRIFAPAL